MELTTVLTGFVALYIFMLAAFTGYEIIGRVPAILHTPLMSGSNFVHGIVVAGNRALRHRRCWRRHAGRDARKLFICVRY